VVVQSKTTREEREPLIPLFRQGSERGHARPSGEKVIGTLRAPISPPAAALLLTQKLVRGDELRDGRVNLARVNLFTNIERSSISLTIVRESGPRGVVKRETLLSFGVPFINSHNYS
jgi:hypothetical protein